MGNCLPRVDNSSFTSGNASELALGDAFWSELNESDYLLDYNHSDLEAAAPCHSCNLLDERFLPFFLLTSVLGLLANGAVLFALLRPPLHWQRCPHRPILVQLAVGSGLCSAVLPVLAPGLDGIRAVPLCHLAHLLWFGSAFAQALLVTSHAYLGPRLGAGWHPGLRLGLMLGLWAVAVLLGLPNTLASDISQGLCTLGKGRGLLPAMHAATCFTVFVLVPLGLLAAKGLQKVWGWGPCPWANVLWAWFLFWWLHGVFLGVDTLVRSKVVVLSTCQTQQTLDLLLQLTEALAILHCMTTPLLLALSCHKATSTATTPLPLPAGQSTHMDTLGDKPSPLPD